ncbi:MAG: thymidine kinase [Simkaniaceae bacterium]|nr:thymidine kinase [Candidatus Sacchlamyda saccharinae]
MAKLYFRHGTVGSAKTLNLLAVAHNYRQQGKEVLLLKPALDDRFGREQIKSRAGLEMSADLLIHEDTDLYLLDLEGVDCILVDEVQFMSPRIIEQLRAISVEKRIPVICYGLRTDFRGHLFDGSKRLLELADSIEEVKATCHFCNRKSIMNLRHVNGEAVNDGPVVLVGAEESYFPACYSCYQDQLASVAR